MEKSVTEFLIKQAEGLQIEPALLLTVAVVEAKNKGLHRRGVPVILFERHIFYRQLKKHCLDAAALSVRYPKLINKKAGGYIGGENENMRLKLAKQIHTKAAIESASFGLFQIMGFHWQALGYESAVDFELQMGASEENQAAAFVRFLTLKSNNKMLTALKKKDFKDFARLYNGVDFAKNNYDIKLQNHYQQLKALA